MHVRALVLVAILSLPAFTAAVAQDAARVDVIILGAPHPALRVVPRSDALAAFDARAAPFLSALASEVASLSGEVVATWGAAPAMHARVPASVIPLLSAFPGVRSVVVDSPDAVRVDDTSDAEGGGALNTGGRQQIQAEEAWALGFRGEGVRIAIVATGIDAAHEAFRRADGSSRVVAWLDLVNGAGTPYDDHGQGTFVAASAAGSASYVDPVHGAFQEAGVAPAADILAVKFLTSGGSGSFADALSALNWSFASGADVALNPWGSSCGSQTLPVLQMVRTLTDAGMVSVAAAGAGGPGAATIPAPACSESVVSVGGLGANQTVYTPSGRGPCSDIELPGPQRVCPDLVAKAANVRSAASRGTCSLCDPSGYRVLSTTSASAAFVAGAIAVIEEMKRDLTGSGWDTPARAEEGVLKQTALDLGPEGPDDSYGWGVPQIMGVHAMLSAPPEARIVTTISATPAVLREGQTATLSFSATNLGLAEATGLFRLLVRDPSGASTTLTETSATLGLLDRVAASHGFTASGATPAGSYTLAGSFAFSWTNASTGETVHEVVTREASFEVRRVVIQMSLAGVDARTTSGDLQALALGVANAGNEDATGVEVRLTMPDDHVVVPPVPFDVMHPNGRFADPPPDDVQHDATFGRVTFVWRVGELAQGASRSFEVDLLPTLPGSYRFLALTIYCDGAGACGQRATNADQVVALPSP